MPCLAIAYRRCYGVGKARALASSLVIVATLPAMIISDRRILLRLTLWSLRELATRS